MSAQARVPAKLRAALRVGLLIGLGIDAFVGCLGLFAQGLIAPLLDVPVRDPALTTFFGGEMLVAAAVYALPLRDLRRFAPALWICALDQAFATLLPAIEIARGAIPAGWKTAGPIPIDAILCILFAFGARRLRMRESPTGA